MSGTNRRSPIGAELVGPAGTDRGVSFRVWAPTHRKVTLVIEAPARREIVLGREPGGLPRGLRPGPRRRRALSVPARRRARAARRSGVAVPARGPVRPVGGDRSRRVRVDRCRRGAASHAAPPRALRAPRRHVHARGHVGRGGRRSCRSSPSSAITTIELMPVAEFAGRHNWGYDGVNLFAPTARLRHARRPAPVRRPRARARARGDPRRRLQPLRPGRQLAVRVVARSTGRRRATDWGDGARLRRRGRRRRARVLRRERRATGSTSSTSTGCASTRRRRSATPRRRHVLRRASRARARAAGGDRTHLHRRRERAAGRVRRSSTRRARRAVERRLPPRRARRADRRHRRLPPRLPRHAAGADLGARARLPLPGPALCVAAQRRAARRPAACRGTGSCTSSRTTIRSRTSGSASGCPRSPIRRRSAR